MGTSRLVAIRADASPIIGFGHAMRCITLGAALTARNVPVTMVSRDPIESLVERCARFGIETRAIVDGETDIAALGAVGPTITIVDGYHLQELPRQLHASAMQWVAVDDNRELPFDGASAVLNHNLFATPAMYPEFEAAAAWTGAAHALLREDLTALPPRTSQPAATENILLSMGGADPLALSEPLARGLAELPGVRVRVASQPSRSSHAMLQALVDTNDSVEFATADLIQTFAESDLAVIGAGTTLWETGYLGIPTVALVTADNQIVGAQSAADAGLATVLNAREQSVSDIIGAVTALSVQHERRVGMMHSGTALFDGRGAHRVAAKIEALLPSAQ